MRSLIEIHPPKSKENPLHRLNYVGHCKNGIIRDAVIVLVKGEDIFKDGNIVGSFRQMMTISNVPEITAGTGNIFDAIRNVKIPCWVWVDEYIDEISFESALKHQDFIGMICTARTHQMSFLLTQHSKNTNPKIEANVDVIIDLNDVL